MAGMKPTAEVRKGPRFHRVQWQRRAALTVTVDGEPLQALEGDTLLTVLMLYRGAVREGEFGETARGGFCCIGLCQDCWITLGDGTRVRACTTPVTAGMTVHTGLDDHG